MTSKEFKQAFKLAASDEDLSAADIDCFFGFGLGDFKRMSCTLSQVARLIRWQAQYLGGGWDADALTEMKAMKHKFDVLDV